MKRIHVKKKYCLGWRLLYALLGVTMGKWLVVIVWIAVMKEISVLVLVVVVVVFLLSKEVEGMKKDEE